MSEYVSCKEIKCVCVHQVELSGERCRGEEVRGRLEGELDETRERLREKTEKLVSAEDTLLASRQQVYTLRHSATTSLTCCALFQHWLCCLHHFIHYFINPYIKHQRVMYCCVYRMSIWMYFPQVSDMYTSH